MTGTILVFLKYPEPGRVKTRLAADLGPERAAALYRDWIGIVLAALQPIRAGARLVGFYDGGPADRFVEWAGLVNDWWPQPEGGLGSRLEAGFVAAHKQGGPVLAIGTDCLEIGAPLIEQVFELLRDHDAVFGPATDGGYYLVGTARHLPEFFDGVRWSSPQTLTDHLDRCRERGWSASLLPELADIDTADDWQAYQTRQGNPHDPSDQAQLIGRVRWDRRPAGPGSHGPAGRRSHQTSQLWQTSRLPRLAIVVPTLNEVDHLPATLKSLATQTAPADRLVVADGGSTDGTIDLAQSYGVQVRIAPGRGRGGQVADAQAGLDEEVVLVAHADMVFPPTALQSVREYLATNPDCPGGCLGHRFDSARRVYRLMEWFDRRRARRGESYGDQAQFFRRTAVEYPDQPIMEDVELSRRLRRLGRPAYLDLPVDVSPRRFERRGLVRSLWANWRFRGAYRRGGVAACRMIHECYYR